MFVYEGRGGSAADGILGFVWILDGMNLGKIWKELRCVRKLHSYM